MAGPSVMVLDYRREDLDYNEGRVTLTGRMGGQRPRP